MEIRKQLWDHLRYLLGRWEEWKDQIAFKRSNILLEDIYHTRKEIEFWKLIEDSIGGDLI